MYNNEQDILVSIQKHLQNIVSTVDDIQRWLPSTSDIEEKLDRIIELLEQIIETKE